jgi:hypothetical protein
MYLQVSEKVVYGLQIRNNDIDMSALIKIYYFDKQLLH